MPQTFGKYTLVERIAAGGMAEVYRAKAFGVAGFEKTVAIKRILPHFANDDGFVQMFVREANVAVKLSHANVVQVFELGRVADDYYIALEFVEGRDLKTIVRKAAERGVALPSDLAAFIAQKVCAGLHHAHTATDDFGAPLGIVHRDISPHNVLVSWSGEVKVADFGIAKLSSAVRHTRTGTLKGKLAYMSPEQSQGLGDLDARSDIFAAGIVLFETLTGRKPYDGESDRELLAKIREAPTPLPSEFVAGIPRALDAIVETAMAKRREDRYQDAAQMGRALATFLQRNGSATGRLVDDESVATTLRELCGPRPVTPTPASRGSGTPVLPAGALDESPAESLPTVVRPISDAAGLEVFAEAPRTSMPLPRDTPAVPVEDRRDRSTSQATFARNTTALSAARGGAALLAAGGVGGALLVGGALWLARGAFLPGAPTPIPAFVASTPVPVPAASAVAAPSTGSLRVTGSPAGALVTIDRTRAVRIGETAAGLSFGRHTIVVSAEDYRPRTLDVELSVALPDATPAFALAHALGEVRVSHGSANQYRLEIPGVIRAGQEAENRFEGVPAGHYKGTLLWRGADGALQRAPLAVAVREGRITKVQPPEDLAVIRAMKEFVPAP